MAAGLFVWDATGRPQIDLTTRLSKYLGQVALGAAGSVTVSLPAGNQLWAALLLASSPAGQVPPAITISGNVLSWSASGIAGFIIYGAY